MEKIAEKNGWKLFRVNNSENHVMETPEGIQQQNKYFNINNFEEVIKRGFIWVDFEFFTGTIKNGKIEIEKRKKQVRSDKIHLFKKSHFIDKNSVIAKLTPILKKADKKYNFCRNEIIKLQQNLDIVIDYAMYGDTHGIYEDYMYINFKINDVECTYILDV